MPSSRVVWLQLLTVLMLVLPLAGAVGFVVVRHQGLLEHLTNLESRYARLLGMSERQTEFDAIDRQTNEQLKKLAYPPSQDATQAGNDAQQRIRLLFADSKLDIGAIQVLPAKEEGPFDKIVIELKVEGDLTGLQNALSLLTIQTPMVFTEDVVLQTIGAVKPASAQKLSGQFTFYVFRVRS